MRKLVVLLLLPLAVACSKSQHHVQPDPAAMMKAGGGGNGGAVNGGFQLISFGVSKQQGALPQNTISWSASGETFISQTDLEISSGNNTSFTTHTSFASSNNNTAITRSLNLFASAGSTYFRLKFFHTNNSVSYSPIRKVQWQNDLWNNW